MSNFVYTNAARALLAGEVDLDANTIRAMLVMSNTTADTEKDVVTISAFTTLDEFDGGGYARQTLSGKTVTADNPNDRGKFDADDIVFENLSAGTRQIAGIVLYKFNTNDADSVPLMFIDTASGITFPFNPNGGSVVIAANANGLLYGGS